MFVTHDIEGPIHLGDRVPVMADTPGRTHERLHIGPSRPRDRTDERITEYTDRVMHLVDTVE